VPLRVALAAAGLRAAAAGRPAGAEPVLFTRSLSGVLPAIPDWADVTGAAGGRP
jgi:hypothetical protein